MSPDAAVTLLLPTPKKPRDKPNPGVPFLRGAVSNLRFNPKIDFELGPETRFSVSGRFDVVGGFIFEVV